MNNISKAVPSRPGDQVAANAIHTASDIGAFQHQLIDLMVLRRQKTEHFIVEERLYSILEASVEVRRKGKSQKSLKTLQAMLNNGDFLAVSGNREDFLCLFGFSSDELPGHG